MSDLISRKDAIEVIEKLMEIHFDRKVVLAKVYDQIKDLPSAEPEPHWIPVSERLPKKERNMYWVCTDTECQCECRWTNNIYGIGESGHWGWSIFDIPQYSHVTAWMPLPELWKEFDK